MDRTDQPAADQGRASTPRLTWIQDAYGVHWLHGRHCAIWIVKRPAYCDRGNLLAHLELRTTDPRQLQIDAADGWPRYFFDLDRAKLECEAWMTKRGQAIDLSKSQARRRTAMVTSDKTEGNS